MKTINIKSLCRGDRYFGLRISTYRDVQWTSLIYENGDSSVTKKYSFGFYLFHMYVLKTSKFRYKSDDFDARKNLIWLLIKLNLYKI